MKYARIANDIVAEVVELPDDMVVDDLFHPDIAKTMFEAPADVDQGWSYIDGEFAPPAIEGFDLDKLKSDLAAAVDAAAEVARLKYITPGAGQAMTYQQKVEEAKRLQAAEGTPNAADYPMLSAEVGITGKTLVAVGEAVLASFAQWQQVGAQIEGLRLGAKAKIGAAKSEKTVRAAAVVDWP